jgi:cell division protein FtsI/penicillin-binding protein 2
MNSSRTILIIIIVFIAFSLLIAKLFDIQILKSEELKYFAQQQQTKIESIKAERGFIYDRNNNVLVFNRNDISFYLDLRMANMETRKKVAAKFASVFGKSEKYYLNRMQEDKGNHCIEKKAPSEKAILLKNFTAEGFFYEEDPTRIYQYNSVASHVLGYMGPDFTAMSGVDNYLNLSLKGRDGIRLVEKDARNRMITISEQETRPAEPGNNIYLTINKTYQSILEEELRNGINHFGGASAIGILMNPNNGEILALANMSDYNPNRYWEFSDDDRRNKAVTDTYEPGSTFKSFTLAALYDQKLCEDDELIFVENGRYRIGNSYITDTHPSNYLTVREILQHSSNIGIAKLSQRLDNELFYKYLRGFGFGNYTSIELPSETKGFLKKPNDWKGTTKAYLSFGYEISVSPIQLITAYCALVNGGILYKPQLVKKEVRKNGELVKEIQPKQIRRVISEQTSAKMRDLLTNAVEKGTGKNAKIKFVSIGGKTGTSQKLIDKKYSKVEYNASFIGFFPAENPKLVCYIHVNSPKTAKYGGAVAAPIFKTIAEKIVNNDLQYFQQQPADLQIDIAGAQPIKENSNNDNHSTVLASVQNFEQPSNHTVRLLPGIMPNLTHLPIKDALALLNKLGVKHTVQGSGKVIQQSILPGEKIRKGMTCKLECQDVSVTGTVIY